MESHIVSAFDILLPIVEPLATTALVVVLVMFLLLRREDVRYFHRHLAQDTTEGRRVFWEYVQSVW